MNSLTISKTYHYLTLLDSVSFGKFLYTNLQKDVFSLEAVDLGPLEKVIVGHNGSGIGSGWYLEKLIVKDTTTNEEMLFPCNKYVLLFPRHFSSLLLI